MNSPKDYLTDKQKKKPNHCKCNCCLNQRLIALEEKVNQLWDNRK